MPKAKRGDRVRLHFTGRLPDGSVFESSEDAGEEAFRNFRGRGVAFAPTELVIGDGEMLPDFEDALVGMEPGQRTTITIPAARAFGEWRQDRVMTLDNDEIAPREMGLEAFRVAEGKQRPNVFDPRVGDFLEVTAPDGAILPARVVARSDDTVTLDGNHPLAGRDLVFEIRLVEIC